MKGIGVQKISGSSIMLKSMDKSDISQMTSNSKKRSTKLAKSNTNLSLGGSNMKKSVSKKRSAVTFDDNKDWLF